MHIHESQLSTAGVSATSKSAGNTRAPSLGAIPINVVPGRTGVFPRFATFLDGVLSTAGRLASPVWPTGAPYGERGSIRQIFEHPSNAVWAPLGDAENDPNSYLGSMLRLMNSYADQDDEWVSATIAPRPFVYQDYLQTNYTPGRRGHDVKALVLHVTQGESAAGCINWFKNPAAQVSSHFVLDRDGTIYCTVRESDTAWTQGVLRQPNMDIPLVAEWVESGTNPNVACIGIECAGYSPAQPHPSNPAFNGYTQQQFASLDYLLPVLSARHGVPIHPDTVFSHADLDSVNRADCPGLSDDEWEHIYALGKPDEATEDEVLEARWLEAQGVVGAQVAAALLHRPWVDGGTTKVLRCERGFVGQSDEIEARLTDDCDTLLTDAGFLQRL
jgi:N-acetyl-anhydromuramyl-L-alanine amidase AmpD